jgi:hypothetical protein
MQVLPTFDRHALETDEIVVTTGLALQELLQGFSGPRATNAIIEQFTALPFVTPDRKITSTPRDCGTALIPSGVRRVGDAHGSVLAVRAHVARVSYSVRVKVRRGGNLAVAKV